MAKFDVYFPTLLKWEGEVFENVEGDRGGETKMGVILSVWIAKGWDKNGDGKINVEDLKLITKEDATKIAKSLYWDKMLLDQCNNQSLAEQLCDFAYNCGVGTAIKKLQECLNVKSDGVIGPMTLKALNESDSAKIFNCVQTKRINYYNAIVANNSSQNKFLKGWLRRAKSFIFGK